MGLEEDLEGSGEMEGMLEEVEYRKRRRFQFNEQSKVMVVSKRKRERRRWWLGAKEVEEMEAYKYLGVWFDVQLVQNPLPTPQKIEEKERSQARQSCFGQPMPRYLQA